MKPELSTGPMGHLGLYKGFTFKTRSTARVNTMTKLTNYLNWFHTYINEKYQIVVIMKENDPKLG